MRTRLLPLAVALICLVTLAAGAAPENLIFILDASNSMNKDFGVDTRIEVAKGALGELLTGIPEQGNVGLMIYGHRINYQNEVESCQDIALLFPLAPYSYEVGAEMIASFEQVIAQGKTPLADSLVMAANELSDGGTIILISDGEGNCGGQHDVIAHMLATMDPPIILHVVGIDVEDEAGEILRDMALATSGSYWSVQDASGLLDALYAAVEPEEIVTMPEIRPSGIPPEYACYGITNVIYGTEDDDTLYGTEQNDLIYGYGGDDFLIGLEGNDILIGGDGSDILEGGVGNDLLFGGPCADLLFGGVQNDVLCGGEGNDSLEGESGNDALDGGAGRDVLLGGLGEDLLYSADAADVLLEGRAVPGTCASCTPTCSPYPATQVCPQPVEPPCTVPPAAPEPACPIIDAKTLNEGESLQLHGAVSDSDCNIAQVFWDVSAGRLDDPTSLHPVYTAPIIDGCEGIDVQVTLTAADTCGATANDSFILHVNNVNHAPAADAGRPICVNEGTLVSLAPVVGDPDGDPLNYRWTVVTGGGSFDDPTALCAVYRAPLIDDCDGVTATLTLSVTDPCGASVCDSVIVKIQNVNSAPTVDLGPDFNLDEGAAVRLVPVISDPQNDPLEYRWSVTGGSIDVTEIACPTFVAPMTNRCNGETVTVTLTVIDPCGLNATDSVNICVQDVNRPPCVELGPAFTLNEGESVRLTPDVVDPDGDHLSYSWTVTGGLLSDHYMNAPIFTAPIIDVCEGIDVTITLTVVDPCGLQAADTLCIHVANVNQPPQVHADP